MSSKSVKFYVFRREGYTSQYLVTNLPPTFTLSDSSGRLVLKANPKATTTSVCDGVLKPFNRKTLDWGEIIVLDCTPTFQIHDEVSALTSMLEAAKQRKADKAKEKK